MPACFSSISTERLEPKTIAHLGQPSLDSRAGMRFTLASLGLDRAQFLGVDWLLEHVKGVAHSHIRADEVVETEPPHVAFDLEHGGLEQALSSGVLPARFFGPAKTGSKRVKQTIPAGEHDAIMFDSRTPAGQTPAPGDTLRTGRSRTAGRPVARRPHVVITPLGWSDAHHAVPGLGSFAPQGSWQLQAAQWRRCRPVSAQRPPECSAGQLPPVATRWLGLG